MAAGGTLRINGNLALSAGSQIYICSCAQTLVTGTATLNGATLVVPLATFQAQNYTFLTALGGVSGTFSLVRTSPLVSVLYGTNDVSVSILAYRVGTALGGAGGSNSRSVSAALDRVIDASAARHRQPQSLALRPQWRLPRRRHERPFRRGCHRHPVLRLHRRLDLPRHHARPHGRRPRRHRRRPGSSLIQMADTGRTPTRPRRRRLERLDQVLRPGWPHRLRCRDGRCRRRLLALRRRGGR